MGNGRLKASPSVADGLEPRVGTFDYPFNGLLQTLITDLRGAGVSLSDVVRAINALGANPQDLISILQSMKSAGALRAELEVI